MLQVLRPTRIEVWRFSRSQEPCPCPEHIGHSVSVERSLFVGHFYEWVPGLLLILALPDRFQISSFYDRKYGGWTVQVLWHAHD